jgi:murein DD-endopeptidase MepM/ murein hydrolase activator NlpD
MRKLSSLETRFFRNPVRFVQLLIAMTLALLPVAAAPLVSAQSTPVASPESSEAMLPDSPLGDQIGWVIGAANGDVNVTDPAVISAHFSPEFLESYGLPGLIGFAYGLVRTYSPVTIDSVTVDDSGTSAITMLTAADGTPLQFSLSVDPVSGLITALEIVPVTDAVGAIPAASPIASPEASPQASPVAGITAPPTWAEIGDEYTTAVSGIQASGQQAVDAFLAQDSTALTGMFAEDLQSQVPAGVFEATYTNLTTNRISMESTEFGAKLDAHVEPNLMQGYFYQGVLTTFELKPDTAQESLVPAGRWSGSLGDGALEFSITFAGSADALTATLDVPVQGIADSPLANVEFEAERPIGELLDERIQPLGDMSNLYAAEYQWGSLMLVFSATQDGKGAMLSFTAAPQWPLPDDPATASVTASLPYHGAWLVAWGGDTEFQNYHAVSPPQRHAYDLLIWRDGSTHTGDGTRLDDFYAYGQQALAPVTGEVVQIENSLPDMPSVYAQLADPNAMTPELSQAAMANPAGNHVVIKTADGLYVFIAHMQPGSVQVAVGDTVKVGDVLGLVGNSGNTSEPHIHIHAQTTADLFDPAAIGVPVAFDSVLIDGQPNEHTTLLIGEIVEQAGNASEG